MTSNANNWTVDDVSRWLRNIGYERYVTFFAQNNISGDVLLSLNNEHLFQLVKCFGDIFKLGDVLKFRNQLMELKKYKIPDESDGLFLGFQPSGQSTEARGSSTVGATVDRACSPVSFIPTLETLPDPTPSEVVVEIEGGQQPAKHNGNQESEVILEPVVSVEKKVGEGISEGHTNGFEKEETIGDGESDDVIILEDLGAIDSPRSGPGQQRAVSSTQSKFPIASTAAMERGAADIPVQEALAQARAATKTPTKDSSALTPPRSAASGSSAAPSTPIKTSPATAYTPDLTRRPPTPNKRSPPENRGPTRSTGCLTLAATGGRSQNAAGGARPSQSTYFGSSSYMYKYPAFSVTLPRPGELVRAYISYVESPLEFGIQFDDCNARLKKLGQHLNNYYEKDPCVLPLGAAKLAPGVACACKFEGDWYRAEIKRMEGDDAYIRYVDFGNKEKVNRRQLMTLKRDKWTDIAPQCIDCRLVGIPLDFPISDEQKDDFWELAEPMAKVFLVKFDSYPMPPYPCHLIDSVLNQSVNKRVLTMLGIKTDDDEPIAHPLVACVGDGQRDDGIYGDCDHEYIGSESEED